MLFNERSTRGRLGRKLGIDGVELYNLWRELDSLGLTAEHEMEHKDVENKESTKKVNLWLEIPAGLKVKELVAKLDVSPNMKGKLESYLLGLQKGKRRDEAFIKRYEELRQVYRERVQSVYGLFINNFYFMNVEGSRTDEQMAEFGRQLNEWIKEYRGFERMLFGRMVSLCRVSENYFSTVKERFYSFLEQTKESFNGEIPLGQEFLFLFLDKMDTISQEDLDRGAYQIKLQ